jgi:Protein of unknown function (DUF2970)
MSEKRNLLKPEILAVNETATVVHERKGSWLRTVQAVAWSFVGLRKGSEFEEDTKTLNPVHVLVVGLGGVAVFVVSLVFFVRWAVVAAK